MAQTKKNNSKKTWIIRIAAIILLIIGLGMIFNSQIRDMMVRQNQTTALKKLNKETVKKNQKKKGMFDFSKVEEIDFGQVTKSRVNNTADAIGAIAVPSVNMYLPIMKGLSFELLNKTKLLLFSHVPSIPAFSYSRLFEMPQKLFRMWLVQE